MATYNSPPSFTSTNNPVSTQTSTQTSSMPSELTPSNFDTLPILTALLTRLQSGLANPAVGFSSTHSSGNANSPFPSQSQIQQTLTQDSGVSLDRSTFSTAPLSVKDIPIATDELKQRLRRARSQIKSLPDLERSTEEQDEEIKQLEVRIREQRRCLERLATLGRSVVEKDGYGSMEGIVRG